MTRCDCEKERWTNESEAVLERERERVSFDGVRDGIEELMNERRNRTELKHSGRWHNGKSSRTFRVPLVVAKMTECGEELC